jgi:hypothetical protein
MADVVVVVGMVVVVVDEVQPTSSKSLSPSQGWDVVVVVGVVVVVVDVVDVVGVVVVVVVVDVVDVVDVVVIVPPVELSTRVSSTIDPAVNPAGRTVPAGRGMVSVWPLIVNVIEPGAVAVAAVTAAIVTCRVNVGEPDCSIAVTWVSSSAPLEVIATWT